MGPMGGLHAIPPLFICFMMSYGFIISDRVRVSRVNWVLVAIGVQYFAGLAIAFDDFEALSLLCMLHHLHLLEPIFNQFFEQDPVVSGARAPART